METKWRIIDDVAKKAFREIERRFEAAGLDKKDMVVHIIAGRNTVVRFPKINVEVAKGAKP